MKLSRMGVLAIAASCLAPCAHAEQHGAAYATVKAIIDYCGRIDRQHGEAYETFGAKMLENAATAGGAGDYAATYDAVSDALRALPPDQARAKCAAGSGLPTDDHRKDGDGR